MARLARVVLPGHPHHVTQRGNGRSQTFFTDDDYRHYRDRLAEECVAADVSILGWCLMPNHVHLVLVPSDEDGLRRALSRVHRAHAGFVHARLRKTGHFWQGRFGCVAMDEAHLVAALAYILLNPVRARLATRAEDWAWSSVHACWEAGAAGREGPGERRPGKDDGVTDRAALEPYLPAVSALVAGGEEDARFDALRRAESIGRPVGDEVFLDHAETLTGRTLKPAKPGPRPRAERAAE